MFVLDSQNDYFINAKGYDEAKMWFEMAVEYGYADSMCNLESIYDGISNVDAIQWYVKSAELGNSVAMFNLGNTCMNVVVRVWLRGCKYSNS